MNNTGGVTQAFASLHKAMMKGQEEGQLLTSNELLDKIEIMNNVDQWTKNFGIPEIMMFRELMQRAPLLFQKTIVVVDLVKVRACVNSGRYLTAIATSNAAEISLSSLRISNKLTPIFTRPNYARRRTRQRTSWAP